MYLNSCLICCIQLCLCIIASYQDSEACRIGGPNNVGIQNGGAGQDEVATAGLPAIPLQTIMVLSPKRSALAYLAAFLNSGVA